MSTIETKVREAAATLTIPGFVASATRDGASICDLAVDQSPDAVFWIASMTKAITAVAAMQLVEQGRVGLDDPLGPVLPLLDRVQVLDGFGPDETPILRAPKRPVTLAHLLTHTAGYAYAMWNPDVGRYCAKTGLPDLGSGLDAALELPLMFRSRRTVGNTVSASTWRARSSRRSPASRSTPTSPSRSSRRLAWRTPPSVPHLPCARGSPA